MRTLRLGNMFGREVVIHFLDNCTTLMQHISGAITAAINYYRATMQLERMELPKEKVCE
jgi:hypothetical protein